MLMNDRFNSCYIWKYSRKKVSFLEASPIMEYDIEKITIKLYRHRGRLSLVSVPIFAIVVKHSDRL